MNKGTGGLRISIIIYEQGLVLGMVAAIGVQDTNPECKMGTWNFLQIFMVPTC